MVGAVLGDGGFSISFSTYGDRALADRVRNSSVRHTLSCVRTPSAGHGQGYYAPLAIKIARIGRIVEVGDSGSSAGPPAGGRREGALPRLLHLA